MKRKISIGVLLCALVVLGSAVMNGCGSSSINNSTTTATFSLPTIQP